jgi:hypothetical protein
MADCDHSTRFACVTRRAALWGGAAAVTGWTLRKDAQAQNLVMPGAALDPAVSLWREWAAVHERVQVLCNRQQELEVELAERVDGLGTMVRVPGGEPVYVCSMEGLDRVVGERTDMGAIRIKAKAELKSRQSQFEAVAEEIGYFSGLRAEQEGFQRIKGKRCPVGTFRALS